MTGPRETAAQLDLAIDALLQGAQGAGADEDGELAAVARLLRDALPRLHPRFSFEELLARRLGLARRVRESVVLPEPTPIRPNLKDTVPSMAAPGETALLEAPERRRRGLVAGGAIASGVSLAVPITAAALVVWRRSRSSGGIL